MNTKITNNLILILSLAELRGGPLVGVCPSGSWSQTLCLPTGCLWIPVSQLLALGHKSPRGCSRTPNVHTDTGTSTQRHKHTHTHTRTFAAGWESLGPPVATSLWSYPSMCAHIQTPLGLVPSDPQTPRFLQWLAEIPLVCLTASFSCGLILTDTYPTMAPRPPYLLAD